jgi:hypothetical protein
VLTWMRKRTRVVSALLCLAAGVVGTWFTYSSTHLQSDDAAQLVLVDSIRRVGFGDAVFSEDHFLLRLPFALIALLVGGGPSPLAAYVVTALTAAGCVAALIATQRLVGGRASIVAAMVIVMLAPVTRHTVRPLGRGFEVAVALAASLALVRCARSKHQRAMRVSAVLLVLAAALSSDPYGRWVVVAPLAVLVALGAVHRRSRQDGAAALLLAVAVALSMVADRVVESFGLELHHFSTKVDLSGGGIRRAPDALTTARTLLLPSGQGTALSRLLLGLAVVLMIAVWLAAVVFEMRRRCFDAVNCFVLAFPLIVFGAFVVSGLGSASTGRYLVPGLFAFPLAFSVLERADRWRPHLNKAAALVLVLVVVGGLGFSRATPRPVRFVQEEKAWVAVEAVLSAEHLPYGYTSYWESHRSTLLTHGRITSIPSLCDASTRQFATYNWLTNSAVTHRVGPSFILLDAELAPCASWLAGATRLWGDDALGWTLYRLPERPDWGLLN